MRSRIKECPKCGLTSKGLYCPKCKFGYEKLTYLDLLGISAVLNYIESNSQRLIYYVFAILSLMLGLYFINFLFHTFALGSNLAR